MQDFIMMAAQMTYDNKVWFPGESWIQFHNNNGIRGQRITQRDLVAAALKYGGPMSIPEILQFINDRLVIPKIRPILKCPHMRATNRILHNDLKPYGLVEIIGHKEVPYVDSRGRRFPIPIWGWVGPRKRKEGDGCQNDSS